MSLGLVLNEEDLVFKGEKNMIVVKYEIAETENPGCNNGNYPATILYLSDGTKYECYTCACLHGCSGTARLENGPQDSITDHEFSSIAEMEEWMYE